MSKKKNNLNIVVFDIEANGLENPSKIHCLSANFFNKGSWEMKSTTDYDEMRKLFSFADVIIGHNIILYDIPVVERILGIEIDCEIVDTLALSWYLYLDLKRHGLEYWGERLGVKKPEIDDWENLPVEEYIERCEEDVKINTKLYLKELKYLRKIYKRKGDYRQLIKFLYKKVYGTYLQERGGWKVDKSKLFSNFDKFGEALEEARTELEKAMPENPVKRPKKKPNQKYKKDGTYTEHYKKWIKTLEKEGLNHETFEGDKIKYIHHYEDANSQSSDQVKKWLFSLGWEPETFNYVKDEKEDKGFRKIPQVRDGDSLCDSVKKLIEVAPEVQYLETFTVIKNRWDTMKNIIKSLDEDDRTKASVGGFTNTLRFKHRGLVNLPSVTNKNDWGDGVHIRGILSSDEGMELCGSDMSSLEDTTKQHYIYPYDPQYVEEMRVPGFDPHLDIGIQAEMITEEEAEWFKEVKDDIENGVITDEKSIKRYNSISSRRKGSKQVNFSATYGVGIVTLVRQSGLDKKVGEKLLNVYWSRNWAIKEVEKSSLVQEVDGKLWLYNPVSKFWYRLKNKKDIFSTLNQGTGAYCFDIWVFNILDKREQLTGQFHDEIILEHSVEEREYIRKLLKWAIKKTNKQLKLNVPLDVDIQFGDNYAQIH